MRPTHTLPYTPQTSVQYTVGSYTPSGKLHAVFFVYRGTSRVLNARGALRKFATRQAAERAAAELAKGRSR